MARRLLALGICFAAICIAPAGEPASTREALQALNDYIGAWKGMTYYVCCSGCRDAFNEDPEKFIKEYQARKKRGD